ncbi:MAG: aspartyl/asparaginyl beta-hydroxylase domain-containing protein [Pseudomonadota bacterium]|jgi:beta-hydroxylase|nr:aspartyl/asparaginyl beta-hydroxylase domain-containing protein [Pseudomonadota bacterium]
MASVETTPEKPATLTKPRRAFIKKNGKKLIRWVAGFQSRQSKIPDTPVLSNEHFAFLETIGAEWETILKEARDVLAYRDVIPGFQDISPDQYRLAKGQNWRTFILYGFGKRLETNTKLTPRTAELLEAVPNLQTAMFSILAPGYHIPAHKGVTKGILRAHLGLIVPDEAEKCRIRVHDNIIAWRPGEMFVFDDTYEHEVWNETDQERVILLFDFDRPMKPGGWLLNKILLAAMKMTAFYKDPKKNLETSEARLEAAIKEADAMRERMQDND